MKLKRMEKTGGGRYLKSYRLVYENRAGKEKNFEIVSHADMSDPSELGSRVSGVSIVAYNGDRMLLLREFRMGANRYIYNLCAGMVEEGESIEDCVRRELYEETGLKLVRIIDALPPSFAAVALSDIKNRVIFAEVEGEIESHASENEDITAKLYSREEVAELVENEEFSSRAQVAAYFFAKFGVLC